MKKFLEAKKDLLTEYCIMKYVSKEAENEYLELFETAKKRTRQLYGKDLDPIIMFRGDAKLYKQLPKRLRIYRGYNEAAKREGISWSLSKGVADWFAYNCWREEMQDVPPGVVTATCALKDVLAYTNDLAEQEVIINPKRLKDIKDIMVGPKPKGKSHAEPLKEILARPLRDYVV